MLAKQRLEIIFKFTKIKGTVLSGEKGRKGGRKYGSQKIEAAKESIFLNKIMQHLWVRRGFWVGSLLKWGKKGEFWKF
jgi:hypothetical protein